MATEGQYNNQYSEGPAHNYSISNLPETTESSGEHQYVNFPLSLPNQENIHHDPARGNHTQGQWTNEDEPNNPSSEQPSIYHQDRNQPLYENPAGPHQVAPVPKPRIKRPAQVINSMTIEPPCQRFTSAEPFNGQEVVKNYTGESTHSEELRQDPHELGTTEHDPAIKPNKEKADQTKDAAQNVQQSQRPQNYSKMLAVVVKPNETITENESYHNQIGGEEAIKRLRAFGNHHYLTRHSEYWKCYVLSVYMSDEDLEHEKYKHFRLKDSDEGIRIQEDEQFNNLEEMLKYYENNRIDPAFPTIGQRITEKGYKAKAREIREQQVQQQQEQQAQLAQAQLAQPQHEQQAQLAQPQHEQQAQLAQPQQEQQAQLAQPQHEQQEEIPVLQQQQQQQQQEQEINADADVDPVQRKSFCLIL